MIVAPVVLGVGVLSRRRMFLVFLGGLAVAVLSFHAREGLKPVQAREWSGVVTLLSDPQDYPGRVLANVDSDLGRLQLTARPNVWYEQHNEVLQQRFLRRMVARAVVRGAHLPGERQLS